ncbi:MAG: 1-deoxy-D-xylulose-5-phosphate reductoisomerase [candidate division WOR-3 bacterium]
MKRIGIIGATGSIGIQTIEVIRKFKNLYKIEFLVSYSNYEKLFEIAKEFNVKKVGFISENLDIKSEEFKIYKGKDEILELIENIDLLFVSTTGTFSIFPVLKAIKNNINIALANKEVLVSFGKIVKNHLKNSNSIIIPVDSEHSAIFQLINPYKEEFERIILTASGGPFLNLTIEEMENVSVEDALKHPTWKMGKKITIDSATLFNKALEIIEAYYLFDTKNIDVVIHPQSIIHSFVQLKDGSLLAHLGFPDMRIPIAYALSYPQRLEKPSTITHPYDFEKLTFLKPDFEKFPSLKIAYFCLEKLSYYPTIMNASNEIAVYSFLEGKIKFRDIFKVVEETLNRIQKEDIKDETLEDLLYVDNLSRTIANSIVSEIQRNCK